MTLSRRPASGTRRKTSTSRTAAARPGTVRTPAPGRPAPASNRNLIIGGAVGGGILLIVLIAAMMKSGDEKETGQDSGRKTSGGAAKRPVDVSSLEHEGRSKCEEGAGIIESCKSLIDQPSLTDSQRRDLKEKLKRGIDLIRQGMEYLNEAYEKSGNTYDTQRYMSAKKYAGNVYNGLE